MKQADLSALNAIVANAQLNSAAPNADKVNSFYSSSAGAAVNNFDDEKLKKQPNETPEQREARKALKKQMKKQKKRMAFQASGTPVSSAASSSSGGKSFGGGIGIDGDVIAEDAEMEDADEYDPSVIPVIAGAVPQMQQQVPQPRKQSFSRGDPALYNAFSPSKMNLA